MTPLPVEIGSGPLLLAGQYQQAEVPARIGESNADQDLAVLLCNPFGQEAIRCHRAFRMIAEKLARIGVSSLRFDYFATGDSPGDDGEGDLPRWQRDVVLAHEALLRRSGARTVAWIGLRLGAWIALCAAVLAPTRPARVILWDPVLDGSRYLEELCEHHAFWTRRRGVRSEALGFLLAERLRAQVATADLPASLAAFDRDIDIVIGSQVQGKDDLLTRIAGLGPRVRCEVTSQTTVWCSNEALGTQWVPAESLERIIAIIREAR
jgi:pimeloyl-ACP methyl ester carboxylesterase